MATADMFGSTNVPAPAKAPGSGLLVTNHLNLMYILASGPQDRGENPRGAQGLKAVMRMVPSSPYDTGSRAEKKIFDRLRRAFDDHYIAYHSLKPTRHPHKRFPEIDFVICCPEDLYVIEVKGGRITCHEGFWQYQDRNGRTTQSQESPFRQAEAALRGLMGDLRANLPDDVLDRVTIGYGVVFPDCEWRSDGAEWDLAMLADARRRDRQDIPCRTVGPALGRSRLAGRAGMPFSLAEALSRIDTFDARPDGIAD